MQRRSILRLGGAMASASLGLGCAPRGPLRIGFIGGLSGKFADLGIAERNGALWAVEEANRQGGARGRSIELVERDDAQDKEQLLKGLRELAALDVLAVVGTATSSMGVIAAPAAAELGLTLVSPTATTAALTAKDDAMVRVCNDAAAYGAASAQTYTRHLGMRRVATLADLANADYVQSWTGAFCGTASQAGVQIVAKLEFNSTKSPDHGALAVRLLEGEPDVIALACSGVDTAVLIQKLRQLRPEQAIASSGWASTGRALELAGRAGEGVYFEQYIDFFDQRPAFVEFNRQYQERFRQPAGYPGLLGADAAGLLIAAARADVSRASIKTALINRKHQGLQGEFAIDGFGDTQRPVHFTVVRNGQFAPVDWPR
ncbi:ABC transporter substrate-binding protein [Paucibacter sp. APW11]|uniref:ABC transporter substrate-binding protein n=1 Tax=Roseateles aquae TaxID=3077235 RepID=A0ABU3P9J7_9BURK|nr:ABC transporter substrate-binding protein [Paucibacter sp. APW11]MDT8999227.1 ABC transporter substrate-binding protein [Paucibacter sp. APW11]